MRTFWLTGEDPNQRLARIREEMLGSSLLGSMSSESTTRSAFKFSVPNEF